MVPLLRVDFKPIQYFIKLFVLSKKLFSVLKNTTILQHYQMSLMITNSTENRDFWQNIYFLIVFDFGTFQLDRKDLVLNYFIA